MKTKKTEKDWKVTTYVDELKEQGHTTAGIIGISIMAVLMYGAFFVFLGLLLTISLAGVNIATFSTRTLGGATIFIVLLAVLRWYFQNGLMSD